MKKLILLVLFLTCAILTQAQTVNYTIRARVSLTTDSLLVINGDTIGHFYSIGTDTIVDKAYVDQFQSSVYVQYDDSTITFVTPQQLRDTIASLPGGHDAFTLSSSSTSAGMSLSGQELSYQPATNAQNGYLTAANFVIFYNKLSGVSHDATLTGTGTAANPLKVDTTKIATQPDITVINDSITNIRTDVNTALNGMVTISNDAYNYAAWNADVDGGASRSAIAAKFESLAGGHDAVTLSDTATLGGFSLSTQELNQQRANDSQNGWLDSYHFTKWDNASDSIPYLRTDISANLDSILVHTDSISSLSIQTYKNADSISVFRPLINANTGKDTTGIYHINRPLLDDITAADTARWGSGGTFTESQDLQDVTDVGAITTNDIQVPNIDIQDSARFGDGNYISDRGSYFSFNAGPSQDIRITTEGYPEHVGINMGNTSVSSLYLGTDSDDDGLIQIRGANGASGSDGTENTKMYQKVGGFNIETEKGDMTLSSGSEIRLLDSTLITQPLTVDDYNFIYGTGGIGVHRNTITTGAMVFSGGNSTGNGGNISIYGGSHATTPNLINIRQGSTSKIYIPNSGNILFRSTSDHGENFQFNGTSYLNGEVTATAGMTVSDAPVNPTDVVRLDDLTDSLIAARGYADDYYNTLNPLISNNASDIAALQDTAANHWAYMTSLTVGDNSDSITALRTDINTLYSMFPVQSVKLIEGTVTGRNIDVTLTGYSPNDLDFIKVLPNNPIPEGDTITLSVNGGSQLKILGYTEYDGIGEIDLYYHSGSWWLFGEIVDNFYLSGTNTGDQDLSGIRDSILLSLNKFPIDTTASYINIANWTTFIQGKLDADYFRKSVDTGFDIAITDAGSYFSYDNVDSALQYVARNMVTSGDGWGSDYVHTDATLTGIGTGANALKVDTTIIGTQYGESVLLDSIGELRIDVNSALNKFPVDTTATDANRSNWINFIGRWGGGTGLWSQYTGGISPSTISGEVRIGSTTDLGSYSLQNTGNFRNVGSAYVSGTLSLNGPTSTFKLYDIEGEPGADATAVTIYHSFGTLYAKDASGTIHDLFAGGGSGTITGVTAGTGISGGGTSGTVPVALDVSELTTDNTVTLSDYAVWDDVTNGDRKTTWATIKTALGVPTISGSSSRIGYYSGTTTMTSSSGLTTDGSNVTMSGYVTSDETRVQSPTISGGAATLNATSGYNAILDNSSHNASFTLTLSNIQPGHSGNIRITNGSSIVYLTISGYTNKIAPSVAHTTNTIKLSGGGKTDMISYYYDGAILIWNGQKDYL